MDPASTSPTDENVTPTAVPAIDFARVLLAVKTHGLTIGVLLLLFYQMGLAGDVQSGMCNL